MAPVYADHPFPLITTPSFIAKQAGQPSDVFDLVASEMAVVHNIIARGLNSIYLQAPHIRPGADEKAFLRYTAAWLRLLEVHHGGEEKAEGGLFADMEAMAGEPGLLQANVAQHHEFHDAVEGFHAYVKAALTGEEPYDGKKVVAYVKSFGSILVGHLGDEIPTLLGLRKYGLEKMAGLKTRMDKEGQENMKILGTSGICAVMSDMDLEFEGGMWADFPSEAPRFVLWLHRNVFWWFFRDMLKFASTDRSGRLQPLYACRGLETP